MTARMKKISDTQYSDVAQHLPLRGFPTIKLLVSVTVDVDTSVGTGVGLGM